MSNVYLPMVREYLADTLTPISIFKSLRHKGAKFLLESVEKGEVWGRYSIIGLNPVAEVVVKNGEVEVNGKVQDYDVSSGPIQTLRQVLQSYSIKETGELPPFVGGLVGFISYDILRYYERLPNQPVDDMGFPDAHLFITTRVIVYDHLKNTVRIIYLIPEEKLSVKRQEAIQAQMDELIAGLKPNSFNKPRIDDFYTCSVESNLTQEEFEGAVQKAKDYIRKGDIFQVVLSQRFTYKPAPDPFQAYRKLSSLNPSPYMYFLDFSRYQIVGSSPECLTRLKGEDVETYPIAGTRHRGSTPEEDIRLAEDLLTDEKEVAEHAMLVDLGRNDIGRVSKFGTVQVEDYMHVENFSHVMHLVSRVKGKLNAGYDALDALISCLPAGTVSGAPKLRAMEIIDELEPTKRGPYAGAVGYFDFRGNMDTCITIRTLFFKDGAVHIQAGAGVVADSVPEREYKETLNKLQALKKALGFDDEPEYWSRIPYRDEKLITEKKLLKRGMGI